MLKNEILNTRLAIQVMHELLSFGIEEFCVCPGARNAPLIAVLSANPEKFKSYYFFEERSAAFFALGRIRNTGKSVAVITTSGTAVGELLPATMEAQYAGLPLVLVTADRPRHYRGSGAPQTAEQVGLFGVYVSQTFDLEASEKLNLGEVSRSRPFHVNVCFDEPLLEKTDQPGPEGSPYFLQNLPAKKSLQGLSVQEDFSRETSLSSVRSFFHKAQKPVVVVGLLHPSEREVVARLLLQWNLPVYFEAISGLREDPRLQSIRLHISDQVLERALRAGHAVDSVIRIGGVPTLRLWRDLELKASSLEVLSLSSVPYSGLGRGSHFVHQSLELIAGWILEDSLCGKSFPSAPQWLALDRATVEQLRDLLEDEPRSEPGMIAALSKSISKGARIYLGNSLPIREWDLASTWENQEFEVWASRGLNGIDGQVSTFLGFAQAGMANWGVIGDLTALYDLPGPWILSQLQGVQANLVVVNNEGGKIFSRIFGPKEFQNQHQLRFKAWADLWGLKYEQWMEIPHVIPDAVENRLIEVLPSEEATSRFWRKYEALVCL